MSRMKVSQVRVSINTVQVVQLVSQYGVYNITAHRVSEMRTTGMVYKHGIEEKYNSTTISPQGVSKAKKKHEDKGTKKEAAVSQSSAGLHYHAGSRPQATIRHSSQP